MPAAYGPAGTIDDRYNGWSRRGWWQRLFERVAASSEVPDELLLDSTHVKAHRSAAGAKGGEWAQAVGVSRGGRTSKVRRLADDRGRPAAFALTPGNTADVALAVPLLSAGALSGRVIADKAYDAGSLREWLNVRQIKAVVPSTATRTVPHPLDRRAYARRNLIEHLFGRLKDWRRLATRYDRRARNDRAAVALVAVAAEWAR